MVLNMDQKQKDQRCDTNPCDRDGVFSVKKSKSFYFYMNSVRKKHSKNFDYVYCIFNKKKIVTDEKWHTYKGLKRCLMK